MPRRLRRPRKKTDGARVLGSLRSGALATVESDSSDSGENVAEAVAPAAEQKPAAPALLLGTKLLRTNPSTAGSRPAPHQLAPPRGSTRPSSTESPDMPRRADRATAAGGMIPSSAASPRLQHAPPAQAAPPPYRGPPRHTCDVIIGDDVVEFPLANLKDLPALVKIRGFCRKLRYTDRITQVTRTVHDPRPPDLKRRVNPQQVQQWAEGMPQDHATHDTEMVQRLELEVRKIRRAKAAGERREESVREKRELQSRVLRARLAGLCGEGEGGQPTAEEAARVAALQRHLQDEDEEKESRDDAKRPERHDLVSMFDRMRVLCETLWSELHVDQHVQSDFRSRYCLQVSFRNYIMLFREVENLGRRREVQERIHAVIEYREALLRRLLIFAGRRELIAPGLRGGGQQQLQTAAEIATLVWELRRATSDIVDLIYLWRSDASPCEPFLWQGDGDLRDPNYMKRMQTDLDALHGTPLAQLLGAEYLFIGNPFLLPSRLVSVARERAARRQRQSMLQHEAEARAAREAVAARLGYQSTEQTKSPPSLQVAPHLLSTKNSAPQTKLRDLSELIPPPRPPKPRPVTLMAPGGSTNLGDQAPAPSEKRRRYFHMWAAQAHELAEHLDRAMKLWTGGEHTGAEAAGRAHEANERSDCERERRNIYRYPPEVYAPKPVQRTDLLGPALRRILDPTAPGDRAQDSGLHARPAPVSSNEDPILFLARQGPLKRMMPPTREHHRQLALDAVRLDAQRSRGVTARSMLARDSVIFQEDRYLDHARRHGKMLNAKNKIVALFRMFRHRVAKREAQRSKERAAAQSLATKYHYSTMREREEQRRRQEAECRRRFTEWVSENAPSWLPEVTRLFELAEKEDDGMFRGDSDDDDGLLSTSSSDDS
eukprot:TRINITY_DN364_c2_g1_i1.p1 TRINITY_DN364_c2_g1~~TRINITY_DN364_c2_g1_i1.p1  ORF type:complete len:913 (+),score=296.87 TRINITY_DN364_c2_g1_i1:79-2739(+)